MSTYVGRGSIVIPHHGAVRIQVLVQLPEGIQVPVQLTEGVQVLLFILYINDMINSASCLQFLLDADDSNLYISGQDVNNLITIANQDLINVNNWLACNKLSHIVTLYGDQ